MAACLFAVLTAAAVTGLARELRACLKGRPPGTAAIVTLGASLLCGMYAGMGWAWFLATGILR